MSVMASVLAAVEAEPNKTAYYVIGGCLAIWAVVVGSVGVLRPQFASSAAAARGAIGVTLLLVVGAMASAVLTG
jgi:Ca2+/Na+ antiporter